MMVACIPEKFILQKIGKFFALFPVSYFMKRIFFLVDLGVLLHLLTISSVYQSSLFLQENRRGE